MNIEYKLYIQCHTRVTTISTKVVLSQHYTKFYNIDMFTTHAHLIVENGLLLPVPLRKSRLGSTL